MAKILGIDLGTTNSAMAVVEIGQPRILENKEGMRTTPSVVAVGKNGERYVGVTAKRQAVTNPANTIYSVKRLIGRRFSDAEVQRDKKLLPYEIREGSQGDVEVKIGKWHKPAEISAMVLQKLKQDAEDKTGEKITEAIITVLEIGDDTIEVKGTGGDTHLGGDDIDQKIIHYLLDEFKKEQGVDISKDQLAVQRLKDSAEKAKHER